MKGARIVFQKAVPATADQDHVATLRQFPHCLFQGLEVTLINATGPEPLEDAGRLFVDFSCSASGKRPADGFLLQHSRS